MQHALVDTLVGFWGVKVVKVAPVADYIALWLLALTVLVGITSLIVLYLNIRQANAASKSAHYSELDRFYSDLLTLALVNPKLRHPAPLESDEWALAGHYIPFPDDEIADAGVGAEYDIYAFMIWNFIETIHDRCQELRNSHDKKGYESLRDTWQPIMVAEDAIHRGWFLTEIGRELRRCHDNQEKRCDKFCTGFQKFVQKRQWYERKWKY